MCETKSKVEQTALTSINGVGAEKRWNLGDVWIVLFLVCFVLGCDCKSCECKRGCKTSILKGKRGCGLFGIVLVFAVQFERLSLVTMFFY